MDSPLKVRSSTPVRRRKSLNRVMVMGLTAALLTTSTQAAEASTAPPTPQPKTPQAKLVTERPDRVAAALTARLQGGRVLVTNETTESSLTYANPNTSFTTEITTGPVRVRQDETWAPIDTTLVEQSGVLRPKTAAAQVEFSAGGDAPLAKMSRGDDQSFALNWPTALPKPRVEGNKATFVDAAGAGADLVVTALPTGFRHDVVLREKPTGPVEFKLPIAAKGLTLAKTEQGGLALTDGKGKTVASAPKPVMYDTAAQPTQGAQSATPQVQQARQAPSTGEIDTSVVTEDGRQVLVLKPDPAFLAAPDTQYPVTVDPTTTLAIQTDTTYRSGANINSPGGQSLNVATDDTSGRQFWRSLLSFNTTALAGQVVTDAKLNLWRDEESWGCVSGQGVKVQRVTSAWQANNTFWSNQPTTTTSGEQSANDAAVCTGSAPEGQQAWSWSITQIAQAWAGGAANHGVMLRLIDEHPIQNARQYERYFHSSEMTGTGAHPPTLIVTYGATPAIDRVRTAPINVTNGTVYTSTTTPALYAFVKDLDTAAVRADFEVERDPAEGGGQLWSGTVNDIAVGSEAKAVVPTGEIPDGAKIRWRVRAFDGNEYSAWSPWQSLTVDATAPAAPFAECSDFPVGQWRNWLATSETICEIDTSAGDALDYLWSLDDPSTLIAEEIPQRPNDPSNKGTVLEFEPLEGWHTLYVKVRDKAHNTSTVSTYSFGVSPGGIVSPKDKTRTQRAVSLITAGPPTRTQVRYEYRRIGYGLGTYTPVPPADVTVPGSAQPIGSWPQTRLDTSKNFPELSWDLAKTLRDAQITDNAIELRVCLTGGATAAECTKPITVMLDQSAFGGSYATDDLGPGEVALNTGDYSLTESDAELFGLSVGRSHTTLKPTITITSGPTGVFGPGWKAAFPAGSSDVSPYQLEGDPAGGVLTLVGPNSETLSYTRAIDGTFKGVGDAANGSKIIVDSATQVTHHDSAGIRTAYTWSGGRWLITKTEDAAEKSTFTYSRDAQGRVIRMNAPAPTGVTCGAILVAGCRTLEIVYASATTATGTGSGWGDYNGLVKQIAFTAYDPETVAMKTVPAVTYSYDSTGHLRTVTNALTGLTSTYYYNAQGRISQITPPGLAPWRMDYDSTGRIAHVQREGGDVDPTEAVVYNVPIGGIEAPIDLTFAETAKWGQFSGLPRVGVAIFPPSRVPARGGDGAYQPSAEDFKDSKISYLDVNGRAVNAAAFGAGAWQISAASYDDKGNPIWALTPGNRIQALTPNEDTDPYVAARSDSVERANLLASKSTYNAYSDLLTKDGPAHQVKLASGAYATVREHSMLTYDEGKPRSDIDYHLVTTSKSEPIVLDGAAVPTSADTRIIKTGYDPIASGDASGWDLRTATSAIVIVDGQADLVRKTRYNAIGQVTEERMPQSNGADAGTKITSYYTADSSGPAECRKPEWVGLVCQSGPKAQPTSGKPLPTSKAVAYNYFGQPTIATETAGTVTRTVTVRYDGAGRAIGMKTEVTPEAEGGVAIPEITTVYNPATGLVTSRAMAGTSTSTAYDTFGRSLSYTDADGNISAITYTIDGKPATTTDGKGTTTYTYDGTDYWGRQEHRGLLTKVDTPGVGAFQGVYGEDGQLIQQAYPNWLIAEYRYDNVGNDIALTYSKDQTQWLKFTSTPGANDGVVQETSPISRQDYTYDTANRLTKVADSYAGRCTTRVYGFTLNSNRSSLETYSPAADGSCSTTNPVARAYSYDQADRLIDTGYTYDAFGRTTALPVTDISGGSAVSLSYYADDLVASMAAGGESRTFTLDPEKRIRSTVQVGGTTPGTMVNHYADSDDRPVWIAEADGSWSRYLENISGDLGAIQRSTGQLTLQLANLRGDIVATADASILTTGINSYSEQTEYGINRAENTATPQRYGWLGSKQRSNDALGGLVLMGARLYNPTTGRFLQVDPINGGSANSYDYSGQDPVNRSDLDGKCFWDACVAEAYAVAVIGGLVIALATSIAVKSAYDQCMERGCTLTFSWPSSGNVTAGPLAVSVPYPNPNAPSAKKYRNTLYIVYKIESPTGLVWKYGISRVGKSRPASQISKCNAYYGVRSGCTYGIVMTTRGWYNARLTEARLIAGYVRVYKKCPPGQRKSCR
ncbi:DNRLRE domain-containing protein [Streptosporangium sp. CA-115845]|uniref:DNRLRE domain-containing protein n=1 Tax=Streptosporangium sp. CA-115845 TaxID=3240071 RepID=UPI003D90EEFF